jgi:fatty-acyl-CoA synthase
MRTDWIEAWALYSPEKVAVSEIESGRQITYSDLNILGEQYASALHIKYNLEKGDRIAILAKFSIELIGLFVAAQKAGFILVPINTRLTSREVAYQIENCEARMVICDKDFEHLVEEPGPLKPIHWDELETSVSGTFHNVIQEDDPIFILYTSGTTGFPKGSVYTHKMLFWNSINTQMRLNLTEDDTTVNCMPAFHTGGWNVLITPMLHHGGSVVLQADFDPAVVLTELEKSGSTLFMAVPTMLKMMADAPNFETADLSAVRYFIVGGEALPIPTIEFWANKGIPIRQGYGLTEVGPNVTSLHQNDTLRKRGSIGFLNFNIYGKVVLENGKEAGPNEVGELWLSGPNVSPGYWHNEKANKDSYEDGWFKTGDLVSRDEDGFFYVAGRKKEMYISGGENIYPREVEKVLQAYPAITDVAVIGVPDEKWGESGAAFIVCRKEPLPDKKDIHAYCLQNLAKFKIPKYFFFEEELPLNSTGKIDKKHLLESFNKHKSNNHENK